LFLSYTVSRKWSGEDIIPPGRVLSWILETPNGILSYTVRSKDSSQISVVLVDETNYQLLIDSKTYYYKVAYSRLRTTYALLLPLAIDLEGGYRIAVTSENLFLSTNVSYEFELQPH